MNTQFYIAKCPTCNEKGPRVFTNVGKVREGSCNSKRCYRMMSIPFNPGQLAWDCEPKRFRPLHIESFKRRRTTCE